MRIEFLLKTEKLPIIYRHRFLALIKEALSISDNNLKNYFYPEENLTKSKITKPFSFSWLDFKLRSKFAIQKRKKEEDISGLNKKCRVQREVNSQEYCSLLNIQEYLQVPNCIKGILMVIIV